MGLEPRGRADQGRLEANPSGEEPTERPKPKVKSFEIPKRLVLQGVGEGPGQQGCTGRGRCQHRRVRQRREGHLYKLWNRMSSGSYMPGPVRAVEIPKDHGAGVRILGVPNTVDRVSQTAVAMLLEEKLEPIFHPDSYGYRPGRSAHDALAVTRKRCWEQDWTLDLDVRAFFDSVPHDLMLRAVAHHTDERWVLLYIERWLRAPMQMPDGTLAAREKGTPQGSPVSPILANLFMHYAFDRSVAREFPGCPFERYADDIVAHCDTEEQAHNLRAAIAERFGALGLELHPEKTRIVYCKDANRRGDFGAHQLRLPRLHLSGSSGPWPTGLFVSFLPAMSTGAKKAKGQQIRAWHLNRRTGTDLSGLAEDINPQVRGWINYYGAFYHSELFSLARRIDEHLVRWAVHKFKRLGRSPAKARTWLAAVKHRQPTMFAHWQVVSITRRRSVGAV